MTSPAVLRIFSLPEISKKEVFRYIGMRGEENEEVEKLYNECVAECLPVISPLVRYQIFPIQVADNTVYIDSLSIPSKNLSENLKDASKVVLFASTIGIGLDRLIAKYSRISPSKAILFQGIGSERVEALCDTFCNTFKEKSKTFPRFSPGYGDLSLEVQKDVFSLLNCSKNTGIFLNDNLLMTPTKSVTAFMGIL